MHTRSYVLSIGAERFSVFPIDFVWFATRSESEVEMEFPDVVMPAFRFLIPNKSAPTTFTEHVVRRESIVSIQRYWVTKDASHSIVTMPFGDDEEPCEDTESNSLAAYIFVDSIGAKYYSLQADKFTSEDFDKLWQDWVTGG